ncbi:MULTISPECIES: polyhydroxyalkanoic acid system family protein [unclassified Novosphingobium]|uniref:polyhydroxyalkanoic acid system family protein n=1 Tax=unclassified Novosphingobium TaxID=2644732 RepID=UPI00086A72BC|nr:MULTISPECIES: polyhydroxyalkanoic acid system family protein [unclassified Novosphingobium]MBN9143126.1 polyhydroxyalkanoic acid system family protein [Novosphingobium sp.]MDR6706213.1 hypothetical protein [Novosphingobium sp. 1748]ODU84750.1 MAG: hypothetical protein ABT10_00330 [Novosphingobium sp. SCN 63-17]OJX89470.1 MAG: hypothetical protein BGP00_14740 [Novosphingobium sp. 63-713]
MDISIPHSLGRAEAKRRIEVGLPKLAAHIPGGGSLASEWAGDYVLNMTITALGSRIPVSLTIEEDRLSGSLEVPALMKMMQGQVAEFVKLSAGKMLDKV